MVGAVKAFICGCKSLSLDADERAFLAEQDPWGLILFKRNIDTPAQVLALVTQFRELVGRSDAPVLIDQEGGRVQRMGPPHWARYPAAGRFAAAPGLPPAEAVALAGLSARAMGHDLAQVGISVDCLPVLDVPVPGGHDVIGDRAYGRDPKTVTAFGRSVADGLLAAGVLPVLKHMPGHGRAGADSHLELPRVAATREALETSDFVPFRELRDLPIAMSAHVVYTALDPDRPATVSPRVISEVIRGFIGFQGLLMTDDLSMKALSGSFLERSRAAFSAGVDIALHCNGNLSEASQVAEGAPYLSGEAERRAARALACLTASVEDFDPVDARNKVALALAGAG